MKKNSIGYNAIRYLHAWSIHRAFYRRIRTEGKENIANVPTIIAVNHQNTLMDPLAIVLNMPQQIVWLARGDVFKGGFISKMLTYFKIMPVFRQHDGIENVKKNDETFDRAVQILKKGIPLALFPEASHFGKRKLRPLKKAVPKIAFLTEEKSNFKLGIHILPVGLYFDNYTDFGRDLFVNIGKPFPIDKYIDSYKENPNKGFNELRIDLEDALRKVMIDIRPDDFYDTIEDVRYIYRPTAFERLGIEKSDLSTEFKADKFTTEMLNECKEEDLKELQEYTIAYNKSLTENNIKNWLLNKRKLSAFECVTDSIGFIATFPIFLYGFIFNVAQFYFPDKKVQKMLKDQLFRRGFNFVIAFLIFPITHIALTIAFALTLSDSIIQNFAFLLSLPFTGLFAFYYRRRFIKFKAKLRYLRLDDKIKQTLFHQRNKVIKKVDELFEKEKAMKDFQTHAE